MKVKILMTLLILSMVAMPILAGGDQESPMESDDGTISGELVILNWLGGSEGDNILALEDAFMAKYPDITIKNINTSSGGGDARTGIRASLLAGETYDVMLNTWPSFEKELIDSNLLQPIDSYWKQYGWDQVLNNSWRQLATYDGKTYGAYFLAGNRSGVWYNTETMAAAGITSEPSTWDEWMASNAAIKATGIVPVSIGAKKWAQTEWFENLLLKSAGTEFAGKLARHEVPWTSSEVKTVFLKWKELLDAEYTHDAETMLSLHWPDTSDQVLRNKTAGYMLIGAWANNRAAQEYGQVPGKDYSFLMFPTITPGLENTMSIDGKNWLILKEAKNPDAAALFIDFVLSKEGSDIIANHNMATPSAYADISKYDDVIAKFVGKFATADVFFVLDDLLPAELSGEFRVQIQKFLQDPSESNIDNVMAALEAKAQDVY